MEKKYFYGNEISEYGKKNGYVDYRCLAKAFDAVLNNDILSKTSDIGIWELVNGDYEYREDYNGNILSVNDAEEKIQELEEQILELEDETEIERLQMEIETLEEEHFDDVFQWYIVSDNALSLLREANEIVYYNEELDMYLWGVTHWGTSWDYVLTSIKINW